MSAQPDSAPGMKAGRAPTVNEDLTNGAAPVPAPPEQRKKIVVVGLGMVGIAFMCVQDGDLTSASRH